MLVNKEFELLTARTFKLCYNRNNILHVLSEFKVTNYSPICYIPTIRILFFIME